MEFKKYNNVWLRDELNPFEKRAILSPNEMLKLIGQGISVFVERSDKRTFPNADYERVGCLLVEKNSWPAAPVHTLILGVKSPQSDSFPLKHTHLMFAHAFKGQPGSHSLLRRFDQGKGILFDLEYLRTQSQKRVVSFSRYAGVSATIVGLYAYMAMILGKIEQLTFQELCFDTPKEEFVKIKKLLESQPASPSVIVIGKEGRCGQAVSGCLDELGVRYDGTIRTTTDKYNMCDYDLIFNCMSTDKNTKPIVTNLTLKNFKRPVIIVDLTCEPNMPNNPLPIYERCTTLQDPLVKVQSNPSTTYVCAIDNIASVFPSQSSADFSQQLYPYLDALLTQSDTEVWDMAMTAYKQGISSVAGAVSW